MKNAKQKGEPMTDSIEFRAPVINGQIGTIADSVDFNNSKGNIASMGNFKSGKQGMPTKPQAPRESIYKNALMQHATILQQENFDTDDDYDSEDDNSPRSNKSGKVTGKNTGQPAGGKKSHFGN